jgi:hypothetical protein
MKSSLIGTYNS